MGKYSTLTNQPLAVNVIGDYPDQGWSVVGGRAIHESCNSGTITNRNLVSEIGKTYKVTYTVSEWASGGVYAMVGGITGVLRSANGTYVESFTASDASGLKFWSDGDLSVSLIQVSDGEIAGTTVVFNEKHDKWCGERSYVPHYSTKFLDDVFMFKNGTMWRQHDGALRNNFFGVQYPSIIEFYVNINPTQVKTFYSIREVGSHPWAVTDISIRPRAGKASGQRSRITLNRFNRLQGQFFADMLRNMDDPRFVDENLALFKGAVLQGEVAKVTIEVNQTEEVRLLSVDVLGSASEYSY